MNMIKPGRSLDDIRGPVARSMTEEVNVDLGVSTSLDQVFEKYESAREQLICEAFDKEFGPGKWTLQSIDRMCKVESYQDRTKYFVGGRMILNLSRLVITS